MSPGVILKHTQGPHLLLAMNIHVINSALHVIYNVEHITPHNGRAKSKAQRSAIVAQLLEHLPCKLEVAGSNPSRRTNYFLYSLLL